MSGILVDTNVLVYAHDPRDAAKQARAVLVLDHLHTNGTGRMSAQTLSEFFAAATRGPDPLLSTTKATAQIANLVGSWLVFDLTPLVIIEACRGVRDHRMPYWDAQIWASARLNQATVIFSEDFNAGSTIEGIQFIDPFAVGFDVNIW